MTIKEIKKNLLNWQDFYGQDISDITSIKKAKTKEELNKVLQSHRDWLEFQSIDALTDLDNFSNKLGLFG